MVRRSDRVAAAAVLTAVLVLLQTACQETNVTAVDVTTVRVQPDSVSLSVGASTRLSASFRDAAGNVLGERPVQWSSGDVSIATVDASGAVTALRPGKVTITATSGGVSGTAVLVATPAPAISVQPNAVVFTAVRGESPPAPEAVAIENAGTGTLGGLGTSIEYGSGASGWLTATLNRTTAPATLTATITGSSDLATGSYAATIRITSASGGVLDLPVQLRVETPAPLR